MTAYLIGDAGNVVIRAFSHSEQKSHGQAYDTIEECRVEACSSTSIGATPGVSAPETWHALDRRIAYLVWTGGLVRGDFALVPEGGPGGDNGTAQQVAVPDDLNSWPSRFLTAVVQEDDAAFVRRYAETFAADLGAEPPQLGFFDRLAAVPSLAAYDGVLGRWLDATDIIQIGELMAALRRQGGTPLFLTMADIHPSLAVSRWCLVLESGRRERFEPLLRLLRTLGVEDFDPLAMQCRVLELRERLREVQLESERTLVAQATEFEHRLQAALQKKDADVAEIWRAKDAELATLSTRLAECEQALHAKNGEVAHLQQQVAAVFAERDRLAEQLGEVEAQLRRVEVQLRNILHSRSWRLTAPLRRLFRRRTDAC